MYDVQIESSDHEGLLTVDLETDNKLNITTFFNAVKSGDIRTVKAQLKLGMDANVLDPLSGKPALMIAIEQSNLAMFDILVELIETDLFLKERNNRRYTAYSAARAKAESYYFAYMQKPSSAERFVRVVSDDHLVDYLSLAPEDIDASKEFYYLQKIRLLRRRQNKLEVKKMVRMALSSDSPRKLINQHNLYALSCIYGLQHEERLIRSKAKIIGEFPPLIKRKHMRLPRSPFKYPFAKKHDEQGIGHSICVDNADPPVHVLLIQDEIQKLATSELSSAEATRLFSWACFYGLEEEMETCLNLGADINAFDVDGRTPLMNALLGMKPRACFRLLAHPQLDILKSHAQRRELQYYLRFNYNKHIKEIVERRLKQSKGFNLIFDDFFFQLSYSLAERREAEEFNPQNELQPMQRPKQ